MTRITTYEDSKTPQQKQKEWNSQAYIVHQLIKAGAKLDLKMPGGHTVGDLALEAAVKASNAQLISVLHDAGVVQKQSL